MDDDQKNLEYLKIIQPVISRMNTASFSIKGFSITVMAFVFAAAIRDKIVILNLLSILLISGFCAFDMYYLWQERLYRKLYDDVRLNQLTSFSLDVVTLPQYSPSS